MTAVIAWLALILAAAALTLGAVLMRQSSETTSDLRAHRRAHTEAHGHPDPKLDRRQINLGPPRSGDRRGTRYSPPPDRLAPPPVEHAGTLTEAEARDIRAAHEDTPTGELPATELPTTTLAAQNRPRP